MSKRRPARCPECKSGKPCQLIPVCPPALGSWTFDKVAPKTREEARVDIEQRVQSEINSRQAVSK